MTPWAAEKFNYNKNPYDDEDPSLRGSGDSNGHGRNELDPNNNCFPAGPTRILLAANPFEIVQNPNRVLLLYEWDHWTQQIWTDGRGHPKDLDPSWFGHSIGNWEGDTLVVDTVGLNDKTWLDAGGHVHSDALHLVERFRRVDHDTLVVDLTFDDPKAYTKPWTGQRVYKLQPTLELKEHVVCEDRFPNGPR